ncbi:hypothetical protein SOVF_064290 [Spinacia oleracea]|uniref:Nodulin-related protein 1 n=1 Tax=Spinacia oleracea TaxID=3562 RepID=A0A9R0J3M8_SPIOL|nr:nodulin-related protein 1-like [Spinacia oleracea]KNA19117.1 hypothetical protein SOVF_064290 [Spinacia oleracea]
MEDGHYTRGKPTTHTGQSQGHTPSKSELMSSAKLVADAAKSALARDKEKIDKAKVAGAAGNLLGAAKHYGKLEEKSYGKYVGKAETYLHQYHSTQTQTQSHSSSGSSYTSTTTTTHSSAPYGGSHDGGEGKHGHSSGEGKHGYSSGEGKHGHPSGGGDGGSGGYGEYIKLAQGLLNKKQDHGGEGGGSGHSSGGGSGGAGDYIKLAQGLLNKKQDHGGEGGGNGHSSGGGASDYIKLAQGLMKKR